MRTLACALRLSLALWLGSALAASGVQGPAAPVPNPPGTVGPAGDAAKACSALVDSDFTTVADAPSLVVSAEMKPATGELPTHCLVNGQIAPTIGYRMWLPLATWNGKFIQSGCGGRCGYILNEACEIVLARGYACLAADMGHKGTMYDNLWAIDNLGGEIDFGFRSTHVANITGKAVTNRFYARAPTRSYYLGASTGGRQGLIEVQRFPEDFDGVIVGEPAMGTPGTAQNDLGSQLGRVVASLYDEGKPLVSPAQIMLVHRRALERCDRDDNLADGIISDPRRCQFDPAELKCAADQSTECLSQRQIDALRAVYANGPQPGSEKGWIGAYVAADGGAGRYGSRYANTPRYPYAWVFNDATNPDIRAFKKRGGKLILYQGWADEATYPTNAVEYYDTVERLMGGRAQTQEFFRLYMIPGQSHIPGNGGAETVDYLSYLEAWVERGVAPDVLLAAKLKKHARFAGPVTYAAYLGPDNVAFSRPVYPYPVRARYRSGDPDSAASFRPVVP